MMDLLGCRVESVKDEKKKSNPQKNFPSEKVVSNPVPYEAAWSCCQTQAGTGRKTLLVLPVARAKGGSAPGWAPQVW